MKKIITLFATVAFATAFVGCGGSAPVDEGPAGDGEEVGAEPGAEETLEGGGGGNSEGEGEGE
jgi:hypothetical protein